MNFCPFYNTKPYLSGLPKITGRRPRFLGKRQNNAATLTGWRLPTRGMAGVVLPRKKRGKPTSREGVGFPLKSRQTAAPLREVCVNLLAHALLYSNGNGTIKLTMLPLRKIVKNFCASENRAFRKAHPICRIPAAYGKRVNFRPFYNRKALKEGEKSGETIAERRMPRTMVSPSGHGIPQRLCARNA